MAELTGIAGPPENKRLGRIPIKARDAVDAVPETPGVEFR
jgi:hypothetical protein